MTELLRPSQYIEYRDAAATILARETGEAAIKAFGVNELLDGAAADLTPVYAFLEAQGYRVAATPALARLGLVGAERGSALLGLVGAERGPALLGQPIGADGWVAVPGLIPGSAVAVDRPGTGLVVAPADRVKARPTPGPVADEYVAVVGFDPADATVVVAEDAMAPLRPAMLARVQLGAAAELLGLISRILDDAIAYTRIRRQFGRSLSSFQVVQHLLGWAATERHQLESMFDIAVEQAARHGPDPQLSATVKAMAGRAVHTIAQTASQVTGGISFTWEYSLNRPHQRALALDQFAGSSAELIAALGREVRTTGTLPSLFGLESFEDTGDHDMAAMIAPFWRRQDHDRADLDVSTSTSDFTGLNEAER